ncbi:acyl-CoA dehydrogenase [Knoellia sp. S7-12]|uniref:acyl-CoA dehydrogenase n=1 Tax=Knoellia sp. S7-12 TaxID=3126698 RepID=UPI003367015E
MIEPRVTTGSAEPRTGGPSTPTFLGWADQGLVAAARSAGPDIDGALDLARALGPTSESLGRSTWSYLQTLGSMGAGDLTVARVVEPHLDALAILGQAAQRDRGVDGSWPSASAPRGSTWGVYAAHAPGAHLDAHAVGGEWMLSGVKPWCSLADRLSHALITAHIDESRRQVFAVDLTHPGVRVSDDPWVSRGLAAVRSTALELDAVPAMPVGPPGWYLDRPGFSWGGVGVAAVWFGGACALAQRVLEAAHAREPDQLALLHLGRLDLALQGAEHALRAAADRIDSGEATGCAGEIMAARARSTVASATELALSETARALGPAPLTCDEEHARRVADLTIYVRQHHGERDVARLGSLLVGRAT